MDNQERERLLLAPYAMHAADSAGRVHAEAGHAYRSPYQRDRDRIVHSSAYRRLAHKTQVFIGSLGDYHRTRLTHTQEVASVARTLARALRLNEDLVEALALLHDIGHPPFGHAGEDVLNERLEGEGGFNHNAQALRIVERLEQRYPRYFGLNLSREVLEGQVYRVGKSSSDRRPLLEVQIVDAADSIAYDAHDADDALELGVIDFGELEEVVLWRDAVARVRDHHPALSEGDLRRATIHHLLDRQVSDLLRSTRRAIAEADPQSTDDVRRAPPLVCMSEELAEQKRLLEGFLFERVYRHPMVLAHRMEAAVALGDLFAEATDKMERLLERGTTPGARLESEDKDAIGLAYLEIASDESPRRAAADYVASFTDRYALDPQSPTSAG